MPRLFSAKYQALLWLILNLLLLWLLLQLYARHLVQQQLAAFNQQYQQYARAEGWPLWQLQAFEVRVLPWRDELQVQQLQLSLPSGAVLAEVSGITLRGLISSVFDQNPRYQLHWQQLQPSAAVLALLGPQWQTLLKPLSGSIQWQQLPGQQQQNQWQIESGLVMADLAAVLLQLRLQSLQDPQLGTGLKVDQLTLGLQQQGLVDMLSGMSETQSAVIQQQLQQWQQQLAMPLPPQQQQCEIVRLQLAAVLPLWPLQPQLQFQLQKPVIWWLPGAKNRLTVPLMSCDSAG
ncbi:hypothetical protein [Rheinheimera sp. 4Y26]|uniref:hypothetical protein n=1 Tax=Rheinheimera sp. 4Y26 TaxID=2977811 RepID=UPI0021B141AE|nr:hypothetical protein [Rheinheimera sp. 4Y26]MCT6698190.1 hypothetical protein [Rheinheimera sp. 4Y26]